MTQPSSSKIIVIGGGIIGCSTAYHLSQMGQEVLLLEKAKLTSGSTWHAAGLVGQLRSNANITKLLGYSIDLYNQLENETGLATGWKMNGGLRLACNKERWTEVKRQATTAHSFGLDMQLLSAKEAQQLWPLMNVDDVLGAAFLPTDGQANPADITQALASGARACGALLLEDTPVTSLLTDNWQLTGVRTPLGDIACEKVVLCCGQWTRDLAASIGVVVPLISVQHQYMVTEAFDVPSTLPTLRDPDRLTYYKEEVGGLVMGGYEPNGIPWALDGIPDRFEFQLLDSNFDHFEQLVEQALPRVPALGSVGIKQLLNGPESFTPDGNFILGEAPEIANVFIGAGFNAFGIASGGGAGMALAEWVANGSPPYDLWAVDIRRFGTPHASQEWVKARTLEAYGKHYAMAWPSEEHSSGREFKHSPLYPILKANGAVFGEKMGWERPNWFTTNEMPSYDVYTYERPNWHAAVAREHDAARNQAVLFDQSSFAKYVLEGPDALAALSWMAANNVDKPVGSIIYTQMLNNNGGIECDLTLVRMAKNSFYIVTGTGFVTHDFNWIKRNIPDGLQATLTDITDSKAVLCLFGPNAPHILSACSPNDVSPAVFPFAQSRAITIAGCPVLALRISYVGENGWELHMPVEHAVAVYNALITEGKAHGLINAGYRAIETLRLEKGYRAWGAEIGPDHTPLEAGLAWAVKLKSAVEFKGREALLQQIENGVCKMMASFTCSADVILLGGETLYRNGQRCGWLSSGGFGHTLNKSIGMGYVRSNEPMTKHDVLSGEYELEVAGDRIQAELSLSSLYDPQMKKLKQ